MTPILTNGKINIQGKMEQIKKTVGGVKVLVVYDSLTGMGKSFANSLGYPTKEIQQVTEKDLESGCFLVTRSMGFGNIPDSTLDFLDDYAEDFEIIGVAVTGSLNWGASYGGAGIKIEAIYDIPLVLKFEGRGYPKDKDLVSEYISNYGQNKELENI